MPNRTYQMGDTMSLIISGYFSRDLLMDGETIVDGEVVDICPHNTRTSETPTKQPENQKKRLRDWLR